MRVLVHPADKFGCGHYRMIWPAEALIAQGYDVTLCHDFYYQALWQPMAIGTDRLVGLADRPDVDVVVFQRPLTRDRYHLISALQAEGIAVVVEVDDNFHAIHPRNPAWKGTSPLHDPAHNRDWLLKACEIADLVTVSTTALAKQYGAHERVAVLPNYVPACYTQVTREPANLLGAPVVGWSGSVDTHPGDLDVTRGAIEDVLAETGATFAVVGTGKGVADALKLTGPVEAAGWVPIETYPDALARLDVGIVPLKPGAFNEAKSWLKGLEMAAVGVPFVASDTGPYRALADAGLGLIAGNPDAWRSLTRWLVEDTVAREAMSEQYRAHVAEHFTIEHNAHRWWKAWEYAVEMRRERGQDVTRAGERVA